MISINGKIPLRIHPFFWVLVAIIGWLNSGTVLGTALWAVVIFFSVLIHEYGHALTAIAFGQKASIDLVAFGGATQRQGGKLKLWQEFIVVFNGPLAGFLLFLATYFIYLNVNQDNLSPIWQFLIQITFKANLFWTILNLLPVHPLDGGRLIAIIGEAVWGIRGIKIALMISVIFSLVLSVFLFTLNEIFLGAIFLMLAFESYRTWKGYLYVTQKDMDQSLRQLLFKAEQNISLGEIEEAKNILKEIRESTHSGLTYETATRDLAELLTKEGNIKEAYDILLPLKNRLNPEGIKQLQLLAYRNQDWKNGIDIGTIAYQYIPNYDVALLNAFFHAELGQSRPAIGWLQCAIKDGLPNVKAILSKHEFDQIRYTSEFQELQN